MFNIDPSTIAPPLKVVEGIWEPGWYFIPLRICKAVYPPNQSSSGWTELSLIMVEKAMRLLGLTRPSFHYTFIYPHVEPLFEKLDMLRPDEQHFVLKKLFGDLYEHNSTTANYNYAELAEMLLI